MIEVSADSVSGEDYHKIVALQYAYARCIADNLLEEWPNFFVDDCLYQVLPRENKEQGFPLAIMMCDSKGMLQDRVKSLRDANIYNIHYPLHQISNIEILERDAAGVHVRSNYSCYQTNQDGETSVYSVGQYRDLVVFEGEQPKFKEKLVILDSYNVPNLLAVPL